MKLEIKKAIDKGDKIILKMEYDQDFADAVANIFGIKYASERQVEAFVTTVIENMDDDLSELGYEVDE
jgi:adenylyl- and sulfurtransferase ThiI